MNLTFSDFGFDWSRYERHWFTSRLDWLANPIDCESVEPNDGSPKLNAPADNSNLQKADSLTIDQMSCEQIVKSATNAVVSLKAMAHENRLTILLLLSDGPKTVGELVQLLNLRQPAVSQLLASLRRGELVKTQRRGKQVVYSIANADTSLIANSMLALFSKPQNPNYNIK